MQNILTPFQIQLLNWAHYSLQSTEPMTSGIPYNVSMGRRRAMIKWAKARLAE